VLEAMAGQNETKANHIIGKLMGLKEALDDTFREM
jgi:hypothetical protein